jgi:hypothetical protein
MDFDAQPLDSQVEFLPELFDDAFADIAEGSDVIGKNADGYGHGTRFPLHKTGYRSDVSSVTILDPIVHVLCTDQKTETRQPSTLHGCLTQERNSNPVEAARFAAYNLGS